MVANQTACAADDATSTAQMQDPVHNARQDDGDAGGEGEVGDSDGSDEFVSRLEKGMDCEADCADSSRLEGRAACVADGSFEVGVGREEEGSIAAGANSTRAGEGVAEEVGGGDAAGTAGLGGWSTSAAARAATAGSGEECAAPGVEGGTAAVSRRVRARVGRADSAAPKVIDLTSNDVEMDPGWGRRAGDGDDDDCVIVGESWDAAASPVRRLAGGNLKAAGGGARGR